MNGIHDLGGMHGHGPVSIEKNEPVFHHDWEARIMGTNMLAMAQSGSTPDKHRHAIERMDPISYLTSSYYEYWLHSTKTLLLETGLVTVAELESGKAAPGQKATPVLNAGIVETALANGASAKREQGAAPRFRPGDRVVTKKYHPLHHTRLPRYARGRVGVIEVDHGIFITPDTIAHDLGEKPQHVYSVSFLARELWGADASAVDTVRIDIWDEFLEKVQGDE